MTTTESSTTRIQISSTNSKALIVGFALVATGGLISLCGLGISGTAAVNAIRRWVMAQQEPPSQHRQAQDLAGQGGDRGRRQRLARRHGDSRGR